SLFFVLSESTAVATPRQTISLFDASTKSTIRLPSFSTSLTQEPDPIGQNKSGPYIWLYTYSAYMHPESQPSATVRVLRPELYRTSRSGLISGSTLLSPFLVSCPSVPATTRFAQRPAAGCLLSSHA